MDDQQFFSEEFLEKAEEKVDEVSLQALREVFFEWRKQLVADFDSELRALHGHPLHGFRTTLLKRLQRKYSTLSFKTVDNMLKEVLEPSYHKLLTD